MENGKRAVNVTSLYTRSPNFSLRSSLAHVTVLRSPFSVLRSPFSVAIPPSGKDL